MHPNTTKLRAREAVAHAIRAGRLRPATDYPCTDCELPAREYDHWQGYDVAHHLNVQPVCRLCHVQRGIEREGRTYPGRTPTVAACVVCGRVQPGQYRRGRCDRCRQHFRKHGVEWPNQSNSFRRHDDRR